MLSSKWRNNCGGATLMENVDDSILQENGEERRIIRSASFAITARVALQLGRESISSSIVAIIELVKNAYDADAENVYISFVRLGTSNPILVIEDDGNGMTPEQLVDAWLVIGTDNKQVAQRSKQKKRFLTGEKGLGRLGLDRLCANTILQTFTEDNNFGIELDIDWRKYEGTNARLESIEHQMYQIPKNVREPISGNPSNKVKGTRLILNVLRDAWTKEDLQTLYDELALLVSPFAGINDFSIWFSTDGSPDKKRKVVSENLLDAAKCKVVAELSYRDNNAFLHYIISSPLWKSDSEYLPTSWAKAFQLAQSSLPKCGPVKFVFYFIPRVGVDIPTLSLKKSQVDAFVKANQGVRIYRDNFRVMPYGKPSGEGDWLNLALRRTSSPASPGGSSPIGGWKLGYNQVVGAIFIERERNSALLDQTNREGIVEGPAYYDLRKFALHAVEFFEKEWQKYEKAQGLKKIHDDFEKARTIAEVSTQASLTVVDQMKNVLDNTIKALEQTSEDNPASEVVYRNLSELSEIFDELNQKVTNQKNSQEQLIQTAEKREEEFQRQKDTLGNLASLGILAATFGHETQAASNLVVANSLDLKQDVIEQLSWVPLDKQEDMCRSLEIIEREARRINTFASFTLKNVSRDKRQRTKTYLNRIVKGAFESFSNALEKERNIKIVLEISDSVQPISAFSIDWESIIVNFITNAVWALEDTPAHDRKIRVRLSGDENRLRLSFADSGRGIAAGTDDTIFLPTFSTKRNPKGDIVGTGMGLAIVHNFVESYHGKIHVESPCDLGGAEFHIELPIKLKTE